MNLNRWVHTSFCRAVARVLVALMLFQGWPWWDYRPAPQTEGSASLLASLAELFGSETAHAAPPGTRSVLLEKTLFQTQVVVRSTGKPERVEQLFPVSRLDGQFTLVVQNGDAGAAAHRVTSGVINLNGSTIVGPADFKKQVARIERSVGLAEENRIAIEVRAGENRPRGSA